MYTFGITFTERGGDTLSVANPTNCIRYNGTVIWKGFTKGRDEGYDEECSQIALHRILFFHFLEKYSHDESWDLACNTFAKVLELESSIKEG